MYLWLYSTQANKILKGYYEGRIDFEKVPFCILDTDDLVVEPYTLEQLEYIKSKVEVRPAKWELNDVEWCDSFMQKRIFVRQRVNFGRWMLLFDGKEVFTIRHVVNKENNNWLELLSCGKHMLFVPCVADSVAHMYLLWGQKITSNLHRIILGVIVDPNVRKAVQNRFIICVVISDIEYLGVEYVLDYQDGYYSIDSSFLPQGGIGSRLAMLH